MSLALEKVGELEAVVNNAGYAVGGVGETVTSRISAAFTAPQPLDPREVADAVSELVELPAGARPDRVSVDRFELGAAVETINASARQATDQPLNSLGLAAVTG